MKLNQKQSHAGNSGRVMEREPISKNRVSPKNDRSRIKANGIALTVLAILLASIIGCGDSKEDI